MTTARKTVTTTMAINNNDNNKNSDSNDSNNSNDNNSNNVNHDSCNNGKMGLYTSSAMRFQQRPMRFHVWLFGAFGACDAASTWGATREQDFKHLGSEIRRCRRGFLRLIEAYGRGLNNYQYL